MEMTFEQRIEAETKANKAREQRQSNLLAEVATYLPQGWVFFPKTYDDPPHTIWEFRNSHIDGVIHIGSIWNDKEKLHISGTYPRDKQGNSYDSYEKDRPSISVSSSRTPLAIAKDIERRFLPQYLTVLDRVKDRIKAHETHINKKSELGNTLARLYPELKLRDLTRGVDYMGHPNTGSEVSLSHRGDKHIDIKCWDTGVVEMELGSISLDQATHILDYLLNR